MSRCASCGTRRQGVSYHPVTRLAGGDYRRPPRRIRTTVCSACIREAAEDHDRAVANDRQPPAWWLPARLSMGQLVRLRDQLDA